MRKHTIPCLTLLTVFGGTTATADEQAKLLEFKQAHSAELSGEVSSSCTSDWKAAIESYGGYRKARVEAVAENLVATERAYTQAVGDVASCRTRAIGAFAERFAAVSLVPRMATLSRAVTVAPDIQVVSSGGSEPAATDVLDQLEQLPWPLPKPTNTWAQRFAATSLGELYDESAAAFQRAGVAEQPSICSLNAGENGFAIVSAMKKFPGCEPGQLPNDIENTAPRKGIPAIWSALVSVLNDIIPQPGARHHRVFVVIGTTKGLPKWRDFSPEEIAPSLQKLTNLCSASLSPELRARQLESRMSYYVLTYHLASNNNYDLPVRVSDARVCEPKKHQADLGLLPEGVR
jgi:hypothetical protein